jgi:hypothetical protein
VSPPPWYASTLGAATEDRLSGEAGRLQLSRWAPDDFHELVGTKLRAYEREVKELGVLLLPQVPPPRADRPTE